MTAKRLARRCTACNGTGTVPGFDINERHDRYHKCDTCSGTGLDIPAILKDNEQLKAENVLLREVWQLAGHVVEFTEKG